MTKFSTEELARLRGVLTNLYPTREEALRIATDAGLNAPMIDLSGAAITFWFAILSYANARNAVGDLITVALAENPGVEALALAAERRQPPVVEGPEPQWKGTVASAALEKIIGAQSMLVPVAYLERGMRAARSVARIRLSDGSTGSGFLTAGNILITNHHVLADAEVARRAVAQFNYQRTLTGADAPIDEFPLLPDEMFKTSAEDDWTAVRVARNPAGSWGVLPLAPAGALKAGTHVNIIQHPGGGPKQLSLLANIVVFVGAGRVQYLTDTLPGSSGSPVFDAEWNIVALHHSGGWLTEPNAPTKSTYFRNEGILIDRVIAGLDAATII